MKFSYQCLIITGVICIAGCSSSVQDDVDRLFQYARLSTPFILDESERDLALATIAVECARTGRDAQSIATLNLIQHSPTVLSTMIEIAVAEIEIGETQLASNILAEATELSELRRGQEKVNLLIDISDAYTQASNRTQASSLLSRILELTDEINSVHDKAISLIKVSDNYADLGDTVQAQAAYTQAVNLIEESQEFKSGGIVGAYLVASEFATSGYVAQAVKTIDLVEDEQGLREIFLEIIAFLGAENGEPVEVMGLLSRLLELVPLSEGLEEKASSLAGISSMYVTIGQQEQAIDVLSQVEALLNQLPNGPEKNRILIRSADIYIRLGEPDSALDKLALATESIELIGDTGERNEQLISIGLKFTEAGQPAMALEYANAVEGGIVDVSDLAEVAIKLVENGEVESASALLSRALSLALVEPTIPRSADIAKIAGVYAKTGLKPQKKVMDTMRGK